MASTAWRTRLNDSAVFAKLKESKPKLQSSTDSVNILSVKNGFLFVWNASDQCVLTVNLIDVEHKDDASYQTLLLSNPPMYEVTSLLFNGTGTLLALTGRHGVTIMELPRQWGKAWKFEEGKEKILCKTFPLGDRFNVSRNKTEILQVAWHPDSSAGSYLIVLDSDNVLRIFDASNPDEAPEIYPLGTRSSLSLLSSKPSFHKCLGDTAVAFAIGPQIEIERHSSLRKGSIPKSGDSVGDTEGLVTENPPLLWPIYILRGNGDVYVLHIGLKHPVSDNRYSNANLAYFKSLQGRIRGPLTMHPPAEDNYGVDACAVLCLETTPPILVIATSSGTLYHCLVLHKGDEEDADSSIQVSESSWAPNNDPSEVALFVYESVELELSLTTFSLETGDIEEDNYTCHISLLPDPICNMRYHCSHAAGVHTVVLPVVAQLEQFAEKENSDDILSSLIQDQECIVEHLVCTKPLSNSPPSPVLGMTILPTHKSEALLISLTSDLEAVVLHLAPFYLGKFALASDEENMLVSPLHTPSAESFDSHIRKELQRTISNPLLKSSAAANLSVQEGLQLLGRATQILREEYVHRLEKVHGKIQQRVKQLKELKHYQLKELENAEEKKKQLKTHAHELAERYEDALDRQSQLNSRVEQIILKIQKSLPLLSNAEQDMKKDLQNVQDHLKQFEKSMEQIKTKYKHRDKADVSFQQCDEKIELNESRRKQLQEVLKTQGTEITELVKRLNSIKQDLGL